MVVFNIWLKRCYFTFRYGRVHWLYVYYLVFSGQFVFGFFIKFLNRQIKVRLPQVHMLINLVSQHLQACHLDHRFSMIIEEGNRQIILLPIIHAFSFFQIQENA